MTSITMLHTLCQISMFSHQKCDFKVILMSFDKIETNTHAPILMNLLNMLQRSDKIMSKPHILSPFLNLFNNKFINTNARM